MVKINYMDEEDIKKFMPVILASMEYLGDLDGMFLSCEINGKSRCLYKKDALYSLLIPNDDGTLSIDQFYTDENYKVIGMGYDEYEYNYNNGNSFFLNRNSGIRESIDFLNSDYDQINNGLIAYVQFNPDTDTRAIVTYKQYKSTPDGEKGVIFGDYLKKPHTITIQKNASTKKVKNTSYIKQDFDRNQVGLYYDLVTIKDYGIGRVLGEGSYSLQKDDVISRYYKVLKIREDGIAVTLFPLCTQYTYEDITRILGEYGFRTKIPRLLIDFYNEKESSIKEKQEIADAVKVASVEGMFEEDNEVILKFEYGDTNGND